jgi:oligogalacturonide lyase
MPPGRRWPSEAQRQTDAATGVTIWQMTSHASIHHNLYFLTSSMTPAGDALVFASYRTGAPNFYRAAYPTGDIVQLTDETDVNPYSATLDARGAVLYFTRGGAVVALDLATLEPRVLADFAPGRLGECALSCDGTRLATAMRREGRNFITITAADGSGGRVIHESPRTVIHPQFHPTDPTLLEYARDPAPRMWTIRADGADNTLLWDHDDDEFLVHETFRGDGDDLIVARWPFALQRFDRAARTMTTIAPFNAWHISSTRDGRFVLCDTAHPDIGLQIVSVATGRRRTLCHPGSSNGGSQWRRSRYALAEDWAASAALADDRSRNLSWMEMRADTVYGPQWTHPHPSFAAGESRVVYTSDRTGTAQVYVAEIPAGFVEGIG